MHKLNQHNLSLFRIQTILFKTETVLKATFAKISCGFIFADRGIIQILRKQIFPDYSKATKCA